MYVGDNMKRKNILLLSILMFIFIICGCTKKPDGKVSSYKIESDKVVISVKKDTLNKKSTTITMENKTDEKYNYGAEFHLEKKYGKKWYELKTITDEPFTIMPYEITANQKKEISIDWEYRYGSLSKGKYRIVKSIYQLNDTSSIEEVKKTYIAAEFTIK